LNWDIYHPGFVEIFEPVGICYFPPKCKEEVIPIEQRQRIPLFEVQKALPRSGEENRNTTGGDDCSFKGIKVRMTQAINGR
jgi:hypothetical protein